jgi:uncharacterized protein YbjQ (UPF0145 family)
MDDQTPEGQEFVISEQDLGQLPQVLLGNADLPPMPEAGPIGDPSAVISDPVPESVAEPTEVMAAPLDGASLEAVVGSENADPAMAVEEMLSAAVPPEAALSSLDLAPAGAPSFRLLLPELPEAQREAFKTSLSALGLEFSANGSYSRLTEYQAIRMLQELHSRGFSARIEMLRPDNGASEDDLALGGLLAGAELQLPQSEGAPVVVLPGNEKEVLLLTGESLPGFLVLETKGLASAHRSIARRFFREQELQEQVARELQRLPSKNTLMPKSSIEKLFRELFLDLQKSALSLGANAVCSVRVDCFPETSHLDPGNEQMRLVALGTAAVVEKLPS